MDHLKWPPCSGNKSAQEKGRFDSHRVGEIAVQSESRSWCALIWVFYCMFLYFYRYCQKPVCWGHMYCHQQTFVSQLWTTAHSVHPLSCHKLFIFLLITFSSWVVFSCLSVLSILLFRLYSFLSWLYFLIPYALSITICTSNRVRKFPTPHKYKVKIYDVCSTSTHCRQHWRPVPTSTTYSTKQCTYW